MTAETVWLPPGYLFHMVDKAVAFQDVKGIGRVGY